MATNLALDDALIRTAQKLGKHKTKKEAVTTALEQYVQHKKQLMALSLFGTIEYDAGYDYKKQRKRT